MPRLPPTHEAILKRLAEGPLPTNHVGGRAGLYSATAMSRLHQVGLVRLVTIDGRAMWERTPLEEELDPVCLAEEIGREMAAKFRRSAAEHRAAGRPKLALGLEYLADAYAERLGEAVKEEMSNG